MAIIKCEECGKDMSDTLRRCPHCGAKQKKQGKKMKSKSKKKLIGAIASLFIILLLVVITFNIFRLNKAESQRIEDINANISYLLDKNTENVAKVVIIKWINECDDVKKQYSELKWKEKLYVKGYTKVKNKEEEFTKAINTIDKNAIQNVENLIQNIGTVKINSKDKINDANKQYQNLDSELKNKVANYKSLEKAIRDYDKLSAKNVEKLIKKIGTVKYNSHCYNKITEAREKYDLLTSSGKKLVKNYSKLTKSEKKYKSLKSENKEAQKIRKIKNSISITSFTYEMDTVGGCNIRIEGVNKSSKTIKYIYYNIVAFNAVDDILYSEISQEAVTRLKETGPIAPGSHFGNGRYWSGAFYNSNTEYFKLVSAEIQYTDGTKQKIGIDYVKYISNWK